MNILELFLLAVGLSMDAFAVAVCKGLAMKKLSVKKAVTIGLWFGIFQALMPLLGYILAANFQSYITAFSHWIAFILLLLIGGNMIKESLSSEEEDADDDTSPKKMLVLAIATSIDALAIGVTFAFLENVNIPAGISFIGATTFVLSIIGVKVGNIFGTKYKSKAEFVGGLILILLGIKILLEGLGLLNF